jgi:hypothetical protein
VSTAVIATCQTARCHITRPQHEFYTAVKVSGVKKRLCCKVVKMLSYPVAPDFGKREFLW